MEEKIMGVYKITNKINGKCYIGKSVDIARRWSEHKSASKRKKSKESKHPLMRAFRKRGFNNFDFNILETSNDEDKLFDLEKKYYDEISPEYNMTSYGGLGKNVYKIDIDTLKIIDKYDSVVKAGESVGSAQQQISLVCKRKTNTAKGYYWCFVKDYNKNWKPRKSKILKRPLYQIDPDTFNIIAVYKSETDAANKTKIDRASIYNTCLNERKRGGGYHWTYADDYEDWRKNILPIIDNSVYKIDINTLKIIEEYKSIKDATNDNNIYSGQIRQVCNRLRNKAGGYYWCLKNEYDGWKPRSKKTTQCCIINKR